MENKHFKNFLEKAKTIHNNFYTYEKVNYVKALDKVTINCPNHGYFEQRPNDHLRGKGCVKCQSEKTGNRCRMSIDELISRFNKIHNNRYCYKDVEYKNQSQKILINCSVHGSFLQAPKHHLTGHGCPNCNKLKKEPQFIRDIESKLKGLTLIKQHKPEFLKTNKCGDNQSIDLYIKELNIGLEYHGGQHFRPVDLFGGEDYYNNIVRLDKRKNSLCKDNGMEILYFTYIKWDIPKEGYELGYVYTDINKLVDYLKSKMNPILF